MNYTAYIRSPEWREKRQAYLKSGLKNYCWICETTYRPGFHIHHRTYKRLGKEWLTDLCAVCPSCHDSIHDFHNARKHLGLSIWSATKKLHNKARKKRRQEVRAARRARKTERQKTRQLELAAHRANK